MSAENWYSFIGLSANLIVILKKNFIIFLLKIGQTCCSNSKYQNLINWKITTNPQKVNIKLIYDVNISCPMIYAITIIFWCGNFFPFMWKSIKLFLPFLCSLKRMLEIKWKIWRRILLLWTSSISDVTEKIICSS